MIRVYLKRAFSDKRVTLGMLKIENVEHDPIFTLENPLRDTPLDSLIPSGTFICKPFSGLKHKNVYEITGVPGRTHILIHVGNWEKDTLGCVLVGLECGMLDGEPGLKHSTRAMNILREIIGKKSFELIIS